MLDLLRRNSRSTIIYLLFGVIIVVFIFTFNTSPTGQGCLGGSGDFKVASVAGDKLTLADLTMAMNMSVDPSGPPATDFLFAGTRFGRFDGFAADPSAIKPMKTAKVMDDLIETYLVSEKAREMGLAISDQELRKAVEGRWFSGDREFEAKAYENQVRYGLKTTLAAYEEFERRDLLRRKFIELFTSQIVADPKMTDEYYTAMHDKITLEYVDVDPEKIADFIRVSDAEARTYADANADKIATYYTEHEAEFNKPERVKLTGVFKRAPFPAQIERADETRKAELQGQRDAAKAAAAGLLAQVQAAAPLAPGPGQPEVPGAAAKAAADPAEAAAAAAEDAAGTAAEAVEAAAEGAAEAVEEAVEDADAAVRGAVENAAEGAAEAVDDAAGAVEGAAGEAVDAVEGAAGAVGGEPVEAEPAVEEPAVEEPVAVEPAKPTDKLAELASAESDHTPSKSKGGSLGEPLSAEQLKVYPYGPSLAEAAFSLTPGAISDVIEVDGGFWVVRIEEKLAPESRTQEQAKVEIATKLLQQDKAVSEAKRIAEAVAAAAKADPTKALQEIVDAKNAELGAGEDAVGPLLVSVTPPFGRMLPGPIPRATDTWGTVPGIGKSTAIVEAAFALTEDAPVAAQAFQPEETERFVVIKLQSKSSPEGDEAEDLKAQVRDQLAQFQRKQTYLAWYRNLRREAFASEDVALTPEFDELVVAEAERRALAEGAQPDAIPVP